MEIAKVVDTKVGPWCVFISDELINSWNSNAEAEKEAKKINKAISKPCVSRATADELARVVKNFNDWHEIPEILKKDWADVIQALEAYEREGV